MYAQQRMKWPIENSLVLFLGKVLSSFCVSVKYTYLPPPGPPEQCQIDFESMQPRNWKAWEQVYTDSVQRGREGGGKHQHRFERAHLWGKEMEGRGRRGRTMQLF